MAKVVDFKTAGYFSGTILFVTAFFVLVGAVVVAVNAIVGIVILITCVIVFTTHYRLSIDFENKVCHDYLWILGLKNGEKLKFEKIEYLFIKKKKVSQTMSIRVASSTIRSEVYDGYLKFSETEKIHLMTKDNKKDLLDKLRIISSALKVKIVDYSLEEPKVI
jgi:hypothetical protein